MRKLYTQLLDGSTNLYLVHDNFIELATVKCNDIIGMMCSMAGIVPKDPTPVLSFYEKLQNWAQEYRQTSPASMVLELDQEEARYITPPETFCVLVPDRTDTYECYRQVSHTEGHYELDGQFHYSVPLSGVTLIKETLGHMQGVLTAIMLGHNHHRHYSPAEVEWLTRLISYKSITLPQLHKLRDIIASGVKGRALLAEVAKDIPLLSQRDFIFVLSLMSAPSAIHNALMATATRVWTVKHDTALMNLFVLMIQDAQGEVVSIRDYRNMLENTVQDLPDLPASHTLNYKVWL